MSKYTLELRELFEPIKFNPPIYTRDQVEEIFSDYKLEDYLTTEQIKVINDSNTWSKEKLAKKIVNHYYMREIGQETIGQFVHYAKITMEEIMEEYLPMIYSRCIKYDPLINVDYTESFTRNANVDNNGESNSTSSSSGNSIGINSDTPQGRVSKESILSGNYATSTAGTDTETNVDNQTTTSSGSESREEYTKKMIGNSGVSATAQKMIEQYRANIRAIDKEIIERLETLFMGLY
nr:MAG TPA: Lower collar protein [Caudoviricetes sp.]